MDMNLHDIDGSYAITLFNTIAYNFYVVAAEQMMPNVISIVFHKMIDDLAKMIK